MSASNPRYTIEIDTHLRDITNEIKKQKKQLVDFKKTTDNMNLGDELSTQIQQAIDKLDKLQSKYLSSIEDFAKGKLSTEAFDKFTQKFDADMDFISKRMTDIEKKVSDLSEQFSSVKGIDKLQDKFGKLQNRVDLLDGHIKNLMRDMKDTIKILKDFDSMTTTNNTSKGLKDIDRVISKLNKVNVNKGGTSILETDINKLKDSFADAYDKMGDLQSELSQAKSPKAIRRIQGELVDTIEMVEQTGKAIAELTDGKSMIKTSASFVRKGVNYSIKDAAEEIIDLQDTESNLAKSLAKTKAGILETIETLNKEVTTTAESFKFKDGGIVIPVILDPNSKQFLEDETEKLVKVLNDYSEKHPVDVTFRLFPMTGSKADVSSISKSMKEVRAEIEKIEEPELKARFSEFSDKLEKQYQQALKLRIAVEISQTADEVKRDIEEIKEVVKNNGIGSIDLSFDISDEEAEKIKLVYNKKVVGKIQSMANSLSKIFDVRTISDWSEQFRTALGQISEKLKTMQPLIQPLADLTLSQDIKKKRGRPKKDTLENKNIIDGFTKTMDLLNKSLAERSKVPKLNAEEFTKEIQEAIDKADIPVTVPVEPDTQGFIEQLEDRLKSVPVNVVVGNVIGGAVSGGAGAGIVVTGGNVTMENPTVDESGVKETKSKGGEKSSKQKQDSSSIFGVSKDFIKKEFANVSFDGKNKGVKKTDEEKKLTDAFYELYDSYKELMTSLPKITSGIEKAKERSEKLEREVSLDPLNKEKIKKSEEYNAALPEKLAERMKLLEENRAKIELIEKEFPSFKDSNFNSRRTRENLLKEFLKSKGIERTASLTPKQYLDNLKDEVTSKGSLSGTGAKKLINSIVDRFIGFEQLDLEAQMKKNDGHSVTELTKNATDEFNKLFIAYSHLANDASKIGKEIETLRENKGYAYKKKIAEKQTELDAQNAKIDEFVKNNKVFSNVVPNKPLDEQKNKLLNKYINSKNIYKTRGMSITDLTDDPKAKNKLLKAYNKRLGIVDDNKKANEEYADSSEKIARKSMFEGVATEELQKKYAELAKEKEKLSEYTSSDLLTDSTKDKEGIQSIIKSIDWLKKSNKTALDYKKKGLINSEGLSLDEAKKRGFTIQGDEIIDALTQEDISKDIIKGLVERYGISEDMLKGINRKSKAKVEDLAKEILAHGKRKEMGKNIDNEMRKITTELSLREKEEEARKKAEEEAQKKNKKKKTESKETKIEATSADEASTDSINKESEALENNTNEQEKNNKVKKEKIDIAQQIRDRIAREKESGKIDTTGVPEEALEKILNATIKTAEEQGIGIQSSLEKYKYLLNFYKESKKAMLEGLQSGQDVGTTQDVKDTQKKINAEKKETVNYDSMSEEELQKCLATEEKILARCKEGSEAYNRRKQTIEEINTLLSSKKGQTDTIPESDLESKENTFQGLIDRIKKYNEEKVKISELKKIYKEYLDLVDTLPYDGEQGTHVWGTNDDDRDITEFLAKQLSKNGYKYSEKYDDFVKGNSKFGFDSDTADNISEIINRESDAIEREANAVKKNNEAIKEKQIEALKKEQDVILETVDAKKRDKISTKELIDTYEKLLAINNAIFKLGGENGLSAAKEASDLEDYIAVNRGVTLASGQKDNGKNYWYNLESNKKYSSTPYGQKFGEDYIQGILSKVDESEQSGEELAKASEQGVRKAAKIESPSKVAETLGEYWGIGYAQGIRKHKGDVEDAVRELVNAGKLTIEDLQKDLDTLLSGGFGNKYKALKDPLTNILAQKSKSDSKKKVQVDRYLKKENATKDFKAAYDKYFSLREKTDDKSVNSKNKLLERFPTLKDIGNKKADEVNYDAELNKFLKTQTKLKIEDAKATDKQADSVKKESKNIEENTKKKKENKKVTEDTSKKEVQVDRYLNKDNATKAFEDAYNKYFDLRDKTDEKSVNSKNKLLERFPTLKDIGNKNKDEVKYADELNKFLQTQTKLKEANAKATDKQADAVKAETEEVRKNTEEKKKNNAEEKKNDSSVADTSSQIKSSSGEFDKEKSGVTRTIKGVITRLNNSDELSKEQLDKADSTFAKWINKAKELGMDVSKFEQDFSSARAKFGESVEDSLGKIEEETRVEIKSLDDKRKEYLNLLKDVGKKYLGEEDVDMVQQIRIKETKKGQFKAISYKVSGKSGSVTLDPNGQVIATRKPVSDDYSRRQETVNTLVKEQDTLLKDILKKEKQIGVARADGFDSLAETLSKQVEEKQKLYDENKQSLKEMGEEETLQQQLIKEVTVRKKQEEEINEIISRRNDKARKAEEAKAEKDKQKLDKQVKDYVDKIEKQNLSLDDQALAQITNANVGVSKPEGYYDYKKYTEGDKWVGALTGADDLINKYKELLQAEKKLDEVTKNYEKAPETYAQAWQDAKDNVSALTGEVRDLAKVTSLDSLSSDQMAKWTEIDEAMEEVRRKRDAKVEEKTTKDELKERQKNEELALQYHLQALEEESKAEKKAYNDKMARRQEWLKNAQKETAEAEKQKSKEVNKLLNDRLATYREIYNIADQIRKLDGVENFDQISELIKQQKEKHLSIYNTNEKIRKLDPNAVLDSENIEKMKKIRKDYYDKLYVGYGKESDDARRMRSIKKYSELNEKVKEYIKLKKDIANGKGLAGDDAKAKQLKKDIDDLNNSLIGSSLYNGDFEEKAMKGFSTIDTEVARIEAKLQDANQKKLFENYEKQKSKLESAKFDLQFEIDNGNHTDAFIQELKSKILDIDKIIADINSKPLDAVTDTDIKNALDLLEEVRRIRKEGNLTANRKANENSLQKNLTQVNSILSENTKSVFKKTKPYKEFVDLQNIFKNFDTSRPQKELAELTTRLLKAKAEFEDLDESVKGKGFFGLFAERLRGINAQFLAQYFSWQDFIRYGRTAISTILDLDTQLVDLRKTTKMNNDELEQFYYNANQVAKRMGVTTSEIISQASAWSRLGFNTKEASTQMAEISSKFASISPGMTTESSSDYLVSTIQAYGIAVEDVERTVLDNVNAVGLLIA